jgi:dolichyl-phosphate-mannose-protein mannosyltransferase
MDVLHLNIAMWNTNNALVPDENKFDKLASQPYDWPFLLKGIRMNGWDANRSKIFMFGNPFIWWSAILSILAYLGVVLYYTVRRKRHHVDFSPQGWDHFLVVGKLVVGGWALHYLPFYIMGRVTYLHHYFPALYFSIFMVPFLLEHVLIRTGHVNDRVGRVVYVVVFMGVAGMFWFFRHVSYGIDFPSEQYANRQWLSTWTMATEQEVV